MNKIPNVNSLKLPQFDTTKIDPKYKCPECKQIMINVHQADDCGCRYCLDCLVKIIQKKKCIQCDYPLASNSMIPDKYFQKKILNLTVECIIKDCKWTGPLSEYTDHHNEHFEVKTKKCEYCSREFKSKDEYDKHINKQTGDCLKQPVECIYESLGCASHLPVKTGENAMDTSENDLKNVLTRELLPNHLQVNVSQHLKLVYDNLSTKIKTIEDQLKIFSLNSLKESSGTVLNIPSNEEIDANKSKDLGYASASLSDSKLKQFQTENIDDSRFIFTAPQVDPIKEKPNSQSPTKASNMNQANNVQVIQLLSKIEMLQNTQNNLINDINKLVKANDKLKQENIILRENIKDYKNIAQELHKTLALTQVSLLTLEERLINQEKLSYDGSLLWKITNVTERMQEAKSGRQTSFYSPPFYTNRNGYKMCARIYLNGDGNGRNTHLSLFFVILRGENDALLRWPFRQKVTFILIDQSLSESRENVYDAFRPDPNSSSFRRPVSDMNIASGLPVFCPLGKLMSSDHEYIKDNTMFIKIIVDVKDLPEV